MSEERLVCNTCFHHCALSSGQTGYCRARGNVDGVIRAVNYGCLTSIAMDPIEKKPFAKFYPGSEILSVGSFGCNLRCPFCQNYTISQVDSLSASFRQMMPEELVNLALSFPDNLGLAFTYNEPLISYEYVIDCARLLKEKDPSKKVVLVTNGTAEAEVISQVLPYVDAMNIDYKGDAAFYRDELHGDLASVRRTIEMVYVSCHLEVTCLVIPGKNDREDFIRELAYYLASLSPSIVLHLSRYFPRYQYDIEATPKADIKRLGKVAEQYLPSVFLGNMF